MDKLFIPLTFEGGFSETTAEVLFSRVIKGMKLSCEEFDLTVDGGWDLWMSEVIQLERRVG